MESRESKSKFWEWLGKFSLAVGLIVGGIFIYQTVNPNYPKLEVQGEYYEWPNIGLPENAESFLRLEIENTGKQVTKNVRIDFPFDGVFTLDNNAELSEFTRSIKVGDLQPSDKKTIEIWSRWRSVYSTKDIKVVHDNGTAEISSPTKVYGIVAWAINNSFQLLFGVVALFMLSGLTLSIRSSLNEDETHKSNSSG